MKEIKESAFGIGCAQEVKRDFSTISFIYAGHKNNVNNSHR
jgi:hypothetical protein